MAKIENEILKMSDIWKRFGIEGYMNINRSVSKELSFSPLGNEIAMHDNTEVSCSLNIFRDGRKLNIKTEDFRYENIARLIEKNLFLLEISDRDEDNSLYPIIDKTSTDSRKFRLDDIKGDFFMKQWDLAKNFKLKEGLNIEGFGYSLGEQESYFINSFGSYKAQKSSSCNYSYALIYKSPDFSDFGYEMKYSDINEDVTIDFMESVQEDLLAKSNPKKSSLESGKYDITIRNDVVGEFLELLMQSCRAESIRQNQSFFTKDDIGKIITNKGLTIISNPKKSGSVFNSLFDSEGITSEKLVIIESGVLKNIFLDSKNAKKFSMKPSGNPTFSNLEMNGEQSGDYLLGSSFLFTNFLGMHMTDMTTGKFGVEGEGFEIKDGKIGNFVKNVGFSGNIRDLFLKLSIIGNDVYTYSNIFSPSMTFKDQTLIF